MSESPIELRGKGGGVVFQGTQSPGGGSQPGAARVLKHAFDFSQAADLAVGVAVWTPAVGDWLLDAWFDYQPWTQDGLVAPMADIGGIAAGAWSDAGGFFNRNAQTAVPDLSGGNAITVGAHYDYFASGSDGPSLLSAMAQATAAVAGSSVVDTRVRFRTVDPLMLVVSGDGTPSGSAFDGSAGSAILNIAVVTPAAA